MPLFPMLVKLRDRLCVVVGGGEVAESKIQSLLEAEARVRVVAPEVTDEIAEWSRGRKIEMRKKRFKPRDLDGAVLVIAATSARDVNDEVFREAEARRIFCNAVDDPD